MARKKRDLERWLKVEGNIKFFFVFFRPFFRGGQKKAGERQASKEDKPIKAKKREKKHKIGHAT